jgi:hypothetical protein
MIQIAGCIFDAIPSYTITMAATCGDLRRGRALS